MGTVPGVTTFAASFPSPLGPLLVVASDRSGTLAVTHLAQPGQRNAPVPDHTWQDGEAALAPFIAELDEYFQGERAAFSVPLDLSGTSLELRVWSGLLGLPHGGTTTYGALADSVGLGRNMVRALAGAVGRNPVTVLVPCHRVLAANGAISGYSGGVVNKSWLLAHESRVPLG